MECERPWKTIKSDGLISQRRCGRCLACQIHDSAMWTCRCLLEQRLHKSSITITLTYGPENLPPNGSLSRRDLVNFLKRLRVAYSRTPPQERLTLGGSKNTTTIRHYSCGEYSPAPNLRPHYHLVVFGLGIGAENFIHKQWNMGHVSIRDAHYHRIAYTTHYTPKKPPLQWTFSDGRTGEFRTMSRKPALALGYMPRIAEAILRHKESRMSGFSGVIPSENSLESLWLNGVPESLRLNGRIFPIGQRLRQELIKLIGARDPTHPVLQWRHHLRAKEDLKTPMESCISMWNAEAKADRVQFMRDIRNQT